MKRGGVGSNLYSLWIKAVWTTLGCCPAAAAPIGGFELADCDCDESIAAPFVWFALVFTFALLALELELTLGLALEFAASASAPFWSGGAIEVEVEADGLMSMGSLGLTESPAGPEGESSGIVLDFAVRSLTGGA